MSKKIIRTEKTTNNPYVRIDKRALNDKRLSFAAKGMLCYLLSKPDNWKVNVNELVASGSNGETSVRSIIKELIAFGYLTYQKGHAINGKFTGSVYVVYEIPSELIEEQPQPTITACGKPEHGKPQRLIKNEKALTNEKEKDININDNWLGYTPATFPFFNWLEKEKPIEHSRQAS
jgi:hypothetical protein